MPSHLSQHDVVIDHLTWVDTFLGAHSVGTLIHNDSMEALGRHHDTFDDTSLQMRPMLLNPLTAVFVSNGDRLSTLGAADLLVFHIESFCIHTAAFLKDATPLVRISDHAVFGASQDTFYGPKQLKSFKPMAHLAVGTAWLSCLDTLRGL